MKKLLSLFALAAMFCLVSSAAIAADEAKEVTLKGTALCAKCELKVDTKCSCSLKVTEDGKDVIYYLSGKVNHKADFCQGTKAMTVTGKPGPDKDGHKTFVVSKSE